MSLALRLVSSVVLALLLWAPTNHNALWGLNLYGFLPLPWRAVPALCVVWIWLPSRLAVPRPHGWSLALIIVLPLVWLLLPARTLLFGDGSDIASALSNPDLLTPRSPLYAWLAQRMASVSASETTELFLLRLRWISVLSGVVVLILIAISPRRTPLRFSAWPVLLGGAFALFQGYLESYALFAVFVCGYLLSLQAPPGRARTLGVLIGNGLAFAAHTLAVILVPVTVMVVLGPALRRRRRLILLGGIAAALLLAWEVLARLLPQTFALLNPATALNFALGQVRYAFTERPWTSPTGVFHLGQLLDMLNGMMLSAAPALVLIAVSLAFATPRRSLFRVLRTPLGGAALLFGLARVLTATALGPVLDWDLYAAFLLPWSFVAWALWSDAEFAPTREQLPQLPLALGLATLLPWMLVLHAPDAATARLVAYRDASPAPRPYIAAHVEHRLGDQHARHGKASEAAASFSAAFQRYPRDVYARREAQAWLELGETQRANAALTRALELNSLDGTSRRLRAETYLQLGRVDRATADYRALQQLDPTDPTAAFGLARLADARGDAAAARAGYLTAAHGFEAALARQPHLELERRQLILSLLRLEHHDAALQASDALLQRNPGTAADWFHKGLAESRLRRYAAACQSLERAWQLDPKQPEIQRELALASLAAGDPSRAVGVLSSLIEAHDAPEWRALRCRAYTELGQIEAARGDAERALELDPTFAPALEQLRRLDHRDN